MHCSTKYFAGIYSGIALDRRAALTSHGESDLRPVVSWLLINVEQGMNNGTEEGVGAIFRDHLASNGRNVCDKR